MDSGIARLGAAAGWLSLAMIFGYHIGLTIVAGQRVSGTMDAAAIEGYYRSGVIAPASITIFLSVVPILIFVRPGGDTRSVLRHDMELGLSEVAVRTNDASR